MTPILGTIASSYLQSTTSFESISTVLVGSGGQASIEFTSIPATYTHLQIRGIARSVKTDDLNALGIQFNNDTGNNYWRQALFSDGSSVLATTTTNATSASYSVGGWDMSSAYAASSVFSGHIFDIQNYLSGKRKGFTWYSSRDLTSNQTTGRVFAGTGTWDSTSTITSIKLFPTGNTVNNFAEYTRFTLYGLK